MSAPRVRFVIGGVQKGGTTALATYLAAHPSVALPSTKEAHVFDRPDFDDGWTVERIDALFANHFARDDDRLHGDATPIYVLHPRIVARIARYNPAMRWILLLRDPVERAVSQYHMERARGLETWPMLPAFLLEPLRLAGHRDDLGDASPLRTHSYLHRGDYARQLDTLYRHFDRDQVLVLHSRELRAAPQACLAAVHAFLDLPPAPAPDFTPVFEGAYAPPPRWLGRLTRALLHRRLARLKARYGIEFRSG